jgi:hypothetical protein
MEPTMERVQVMLGDQDDAIQTLLSQLEQLEVSEDIMCQAYHLYSVTSMVNKAFMGLCSTTHAETEEPTLREVMDQLADQFNTRMDAMEARQAQQSSPHAQIHCHNKPTNTSNKGHVSHICDFCFTKTGKRFFHAQIDCNRKKKFSQKSRKFSKNI